MASGDADAALHKFEVAIDLVTDVQRTDRASQKLIEEKNTQKSCRETREQATNDGKSHSRRMNDDGMRITPAQVKDIVKKFKTFDRNSDKSLDLEEMTTVFRALGQNPTKAQIKAMMKEADKDAADCILCYQCDSLNYRTCAVQTCAGNRCQTRTAMNGQVTHMCGVPMGADGCRTTSFGEKICICATDKCNNEGINESENDNGAGGIGQAAFQMVLACGLLIRALIL